MFDITVKVTRKDSEPFSKPLFGLVGNYLCIEDVLVTALTTLGGAHQLGLTPAERSQLLDELQSKRLDRHDTYANATCAFGDVVFSWVHRNLEETCESVATAVTMLTVESPEGNQNVDIVAPVHGAPASTGLELALLHCKNTQHLAAATCSVSSTAGWTGPLVLMAPDSPYRAFYEGTYLREIPAEKPDDMQDIHLVVTLVTNNICSLQAPGNPAWFDTLVFTGDYSDRENPFQALYRWFQKVSPVPFRNAAGAEPGEDLARSQMTEIENLLRILAGPDGAEGRIGVGEVLTFGSAAGVALQISRTVPPLGNLFGSPAMF